MKKEKYIQIFSYLKEFSKLRSRPARDIEVQETQYPEKIWLAQIPKHDLFENILWEDHTSGNYWLRIRKPKEPKNPQFPKLSENLEKWIVKDTLLDSDEKPQLKRGIEENGSTITLDKQLDIQKEFDQYVNNKWLNDLLEYLKKHEDYKAEYEVFQNLNDTYKDFFRIYNNAQKFGEEYELVIGIGLLNYRANDSSPRILRHLVTQRVDIDFKYTQKSSEIIVKQNLEATPKVETDAIIDLPELFEVPQIINVEKKINELIEADEITSVFENWEDSLRMFAERIAPDGVYDHIVERPPQVKINPTITYSPTLILRKRNTRSFTELYENILQWLADYHGEVDIPSMDELIGVPVEERVLVSPGEGLNVTEPLRPILFPKEFNEEQIEIIRKARNNDKVLVQGPPGTGKSHTIANLICHLLANGQKVLVTAYTKRALEVLKDKLPKDFQNLTVNLLGGDSSSMDELQGSVNAIRDKLSITDLDLLQKEINDLEKKWNKTREKIAARKNSLAQIKERDSRDHSFNGAYSGSLIQIAEKIEQDQAKYEWYKDSFDEIENQEIIYQLNDFITRYESYKNVDTSLFDLYIPKKQNLPSLDQVKDLSKLAINLKGYDGYDARPIRCKDYPELQSLLLTLLEHYKDINQSKLSFKDEILEAFAEGNDKKWIQKAALSRSLLGNLKEYNLREKDKDVEIRYPTDKSLKQLKTEATVLYDYLKEGNKLRGLRFKFKKPFLSQEINERLNFVDQIKVNGSPCDTIEEFELVLEDIAIRQDFIEMDQIWPVQVPSSNFFNKYYELSTLTEETDKLLVSLKESEKIRLQIQTRSDLRITPFATSELAGIIKDVNYNHIKQEISLQKPAIDKSIKYLDQQDFHPIKNKLTEALKNIDLEAYREELEQLQSTLEQKAQFHEFQKAKAGLSKLLPNLISSIISREFTQEDMPRLSGALRFRNAYNQLQKLLNKDRESDLEDELQHFEHTEKKLISELASKKAWYTVVERLKQNPSLRRHLDAWVMAVKKIGKTGRGKRALKFRKVAQQEMKHCKDSVPCWVMPLYKVAETIEAKQGIFDCVIIDEASQLGPDAIFLMFIAKKIIIVGDDKQTSPEYVGVNADSMNPHIKRHLKGIPFANYYGTEFSFFDHAMLFCEGITVLREHFRCMPEIIAFSDKLFYKPDNHGLYPLRQYSEDRLPPLNTVYCEKGYIEGKNSNIVNAPEGEALVQKISSLIKDEKYNGKSFGVITLQGNQQANLIESHLLKEIGEKEFHERDIVCGNSASFQGDERDIMFLSLVTAHNHRRAPLVKPEDERRFNVAVSRARDQVWLFHSVQLGDLGNTNDLRYKLLDHFQNYDAYQRIYNEPIERKRGNQPDPFDSWFEVDVFNDIVQRRYDVIPQYHVASGRYRIDLVTILPNGTKVAIECDGDKWHGVDKYLDDMMRQKVLERCGWQFFRVRGHEYYSNRSKALQPLWSLIEKLSAPKYDDQIVGASKNQEISNQQEELQHTSPTEHSIDQVFEAEPKQKNPTITSSSDHKQPEERPQKDLDLFSLYQFVSKPLHSKETDLNVSEDPKFELTATESVSKVSERLGTHLSLRFFNLYKSGEYMLTTFERKDADYCVPITSSVENGFLLQGYVSGHVNKVRISTLLAKKLNRPYKNGLNSQDQLVMLKIIASDKVIGMLFEEDGIQKFKAHLTENITHRDQLHLKGYKVMYNTFSDLNYLIFPLKIQKDISRLIFTSFTANGKPTSNNYYDFEWKILHKYHNFAKYFSQTGDSIPEEKSLFDIAKIEINSIAKLHFINDNVIKKVKVVDKAGELYTSNNGIQSVYYKKPLAQAILEKQVGDTVFIPGTFNKVKILSIN